MIELVIKIPEEQYLLILESHRNSAATFVSKEAMMYSIKNGTLLPKGVCDCIKILQETRENG